jgi:hypothetical protein
MGTSPLDRIFQSIQIVQPVRIVRSPEIAENLTAEILRRTEP